jgi:hypothetical protein
LLQRFALDEPGPAAVAEVIHDIDLKESRFGRPAWLAHYATKRSVVP